VDSVGKGEKSVQTFHIQMPWWMLQGRSLGSEPGLGAKVLSKSREVEVMQPMQVDVCSKPAGSVVDAIAIQDCGLSGEGVVQKDLVAVAQKNAVGSILVAPAKVEDKGVQEGVASVEDYNENFSDSGSLNSEEEQELDDYFKGIEEENMVEDDSMGQGEDRSVVLTAIPEASHLMSGR
jgi:hypothetical protein